MKMRIHIHINSIKDFLAGTEVDARLGEFQGLAMFLVDMSEIELTLPKNTGLVDMMAGTVSIKVKLKSPVA